MTLYCVSKRLIVFISIILILFSYKINPIISKSCSEDIDCGTNIKYKQCIEKECEKCTIDSKCTINKGDICHINSGYCEMHPVFSPFTTSDIITTISIFIGALIAAGGGLGGGGIFVPIFILIIGFDAKSAAALSQATIAGGSVINLIMNFRQKHPMRNHRTLADLPTMLILSPLLLGGTVIGVLLNEILPDPIIVTCMIIVLLYATYRTLRKGIKLWKTENENNKLKRQSEIAKYGGDYIKIRKDSHSLSQRKQENINNMRNDYNNDQPKKFQSQSQYGAQFNNVVDQNFMYDSQSQATSVVSQPLTENNEQPNDLRTPHNPNNPNNPNNNTDNEAQIQYPKVRNDYHRQLIHEESDLFADLPNEQDDAQSNIPWLDKLAIQSGQNTYFLQSKLNQKSLSILENLMNEESQILKPMIIIFLVWLIVSIFSILRSTDLIIHNLNCGSISYWIIYLAIYPCLILITIIICKKQVSSYQLKLSLYWMPCEGDIEWSYKYAIIYPTIAMFAGLLGGLLGIGGGMIVSPLLLELGVLPRVAAATSAIAVAVTSSSSTLQKFLVGMLRVDYMLFFMGVGMIGTFIGQTIVDYSIKKFGRASIVVFAVTTVIGVAVILMGADGVLDMKWEFEFSSVCG